MVGQADLAGRLLPGGRHCPGAQMGLPDESGRQGA